MLAFSDGYTVYPLPAAQDHKRIGDGDTGPNTGGMGAYAPAPVATPAVMQQIVSEVLQPTVNGMRREGWNSLPFQTSYLLSNRFPLRWIIIYRVHTHKQWTKGPRVQR